MTVKACERLDLVLDVVGANRLVEQLDKRRVDRIELEDVVVDHHERIVYLGAVGARAVGEHGNLGVWGQLVAKRDAPAMPAETPVRRWARRCLRR